jgi:hypothetical protein
MHAWHEGVREATHYSDINEVAKRYLLLKPAFYFNIIQYKWQIKVVNECVPRCWTGGLSACIETFIYCTVLKASKGDAVFKQSR